MKVIENIDPVRVPGAVKKIKVTRGKTVQPQKQEEEQEEIIEKEQTDTKHQHNYKTPIGHDQNDTLRPGECDKSDDSSKGSHQHGRMPEQSEEKREEEKQEDEKQTL